MGRPKCYASPAVRQAAYRQRLQAEMVLVNRHSLTEWEARIERLVAAITQAATVGDPLACQVHSPGHGDATLDKLIAWFTTREREVVPSTTDADDPCPAPARSALGLCQMNDPTGG